jgi:hypothetical protein
MRSLTYKTGRQRSKPLRHSARMGVPRRVRPAYRPPSWLLVLPALALLGGAVNAATYYVGPHGADSLSNNAAASGSLRFALAHAPAGSTVILEDGRYDGAPDGYSVTVSGVTFRARHWHGAIITNSTGANLFGPASQQVIDDVCQGIVFGPCVRPITGGWSGGGGDGWRFLDCEFRANDGVGFGKNGLVRHCLFTDAWSNSFDVNSTSGFVMQNSIARRGNRANADSDGVGNKCDFAQSLTFDGLIAYDNAGPGLWFDTRNPNWIVRNCTFFANHGGANWFTLSVGNGTSATQFTGFGQDGEGVAVGARLMAISGTQANLHFQTTVTAVSGSNPQTFAVDPPLPAIPAHDDQFAAQHPNSLAVGSGVISEANWGPGLAENNVFYSNTDNGIEDNDSGSKSPITIRGNRFVANHARGIQFRGIADMGGNEGNSERKRGANLITDLARVGKDGSYGSWVGADRAVSWRDGASADPAGQDHGYIWQNAPNGNQGWSFSAPADVAPRMLSIYAGGFQAQITLTAHLSDGSAPDYTVTKTYGGAGMDLFTIAYHAAGAGQKLTVTFIKSGTDGVHLNGSADLVAAWLAAGGGTIGPGEISGSNAPASASYDLSSVGALDWVHWGRIAFTPRDRLLGVALVTGNVFKDNGLAWGTANEDHVLATPRAMGSVIDNNIYDVAPGRHGPWGSWKPTDARQPILVRGLAQMQSRLGIEAHGTAQHVAFRGTLVPTAIWPPSSDTEWSHVFYPSNTYAAGSGIRQVNDDETPYIQNAVTHAGAGQKVTIRVFGHTPFQGNGPYTCEVYDYSGRWMQLSLPSRADCNALDAVVPPYAVLTPASIAVTLRSVDPYNLTATYAGHGRPSHSIATAHRF